MKLKSPLNLIMSLAIVLSLLPTLGVAAPVAAPASPQTSKIEDQLLDLFAVKGSSDFMVRFAEQADLSPAYSMGWDARGEFVVNALTAATQRSQVQAKTYLDGRGLTYETFIAGNELYVYAGDQTAAESLSALAEVGYIRAPRTYYIDPIIDSEAAVPQGPDALAWGIIDTNADDFWATFGVQGNGIVVANIDTGVQYNHPGLDQAFKCASPTDPACWSDPSNICGAAGACDNNGHGTHTMGTMVADDDASLTWQAGMAPNATWIACKGCETTGCSDTALNACADWILAPGGSAANRPNVVNNSWGGGGGDSWYQAKVQAWVAAGIFPAFSAGNSSGCSSLGSPGDYQESFGTTGHDVNRNHNYAQGPSAFGHEPYTKPNISGPAISVCSTIPTNQWTCGYSGTSMASPHTAGAVALLWSCNPSLIGQVDATFQALQNGADAPTPASPSCGVPPDGEGTYEDGYGYLNIYQTGLAYCGGVETGYLDGYVSDTGGNPLDGASVSATPAIKGNGIDAITDPTGYYTMTLTPGTYDVTASKDGYTSQTVTGVVIVTDTVTSQDFALTFPGQWMLGPSMCFDLTRIDAEYFPTTGMLYILGGRSDTTTIGNIYSFDPATNTCVDTGVDMPNPISNYTANLVNDGTNDLLCTFGGRQSDGTPTLNVQCYDPIANTAAIKTNLSAAWTGYTPGAQVVLDNQVYIFGGLNVLAAPYMIARTERYDPVTNTFTQLGDLNLARSYILAGAVDGIIYAFGGDTFDGAALIAQTMAEKMDPAVGTWDDAGVADLPIAGDEGRAFAFDSNSIYPYAGQIVLATMAQWQDPSAEVVLYDVASDTYDTTFPDLINARRNQGGAFIPIYTEDPDDGLPGMWVFGGYLTGDFPPYAPPEFFIAPCSLEPGDQHLDMGRQYRLGFHQPDGVTFTYTQTLAALQQQQSLSQFAEAESWYRRYLLCYPSSEVALSRLLDTRWEIATAHLLGGNDWMVQALDVKFSNPSDPLLDDIDKLNDALGEFTLATESYTSLLTSEFYTTFMALQPTRVDPLTGEATPYLDIQRLALASAEKSRAYVEKAERQFRLFTTADQTDTMQTLRQGMSAAVSEAVLLRTLWDDIAADVSYQAILRNIADMQRIFRYLQTGKNPFGYEADYVPIRFLPSHLPDNNFEQTWDLAYQEWTVARDMVEYAQGIQEQIENDYDQLQQNLQSTIANYNTQLLQLCGPDAGGQPDLENCHQNTAGEIYGQLLRIKAALLRIDLVQQQMDNQRSLIDIEQQRAARVAGIQRGTALMISNTGEPLASLASEETKLRLRKTWGDYASGTLSGYLSGIGSGGGGGRNVDWGPLAGAILGGLSVAASQLGNRSGHLGDLAAQRERLQAQQAAAVHYAEAEITDVNSEALIKQYMLRFTEYDIEMSLAANNLRQELTRLNGLKAQAEYLASEKDKAIAFNLLLFQDPAQRVMRDYYMELANARFDVALRYAWIAGRALEYEINQHVLFTNGPLTNLDSLYRIRDVVTLEAALAQMNTAYNDFLGRDDVPAPQQREDIIYLSQALGFEDTWDPDLGRWVTREEKFNAFVRDRAHWVDLNDDGTKESLRFTFQTSIFLGNLFFPTSVFNDKIVSIKMRVWGNGLGDDRAVIHLKQEGASFIRTVDAFNPLDEVFEYNISPLKASIMAATNLNELPDPVAINRELASRSVACTDWTLTLDEVNEPNNWDVNIDNIEEIELIMTHETYTLQHLLGAPKEASDAKPQLDLDLFEPPPNRPYQPVLPIVRLFWSFFHFSR